MQWDDLGYLISKNSYSENSVIVELYTEHHGKCSGIIFGATSKKIKNYLQIGNKLNVNYNYKSEGKLGYFKIEIFEVHTPYYFENKKKLLCIISAMNLVKLLTAELQKNIKIFKLINNFFLLLKSNSWIKEYILWELKLLEFVGYKLQLKKIAKLETSNNEKKYFVLSSLEKKYVPNFLIDVNETEPDKQNISQGLKLVGDFLEKNILKPNNMNYPISRLEFLNLFK